jgi:inner membrane protein
MEPVTHFLTGAAISRGFGLNRKTALATLTLVLAAEAPDLDMIFYPFSRVLGFGHHRGITHTLLGAPFVAAGVLGIVYLIHQNQVKRRAEKERQKAEAEDARRAADPGRYKADDHVPIVIEPLPVRWKLLYVYALIGALSHLLLDFTNSYGIRPFEPFNWTWYSWDIVSIVEFSILIPLVLALIGPWFFQLMGSELGARRNRFPGRPSAIAALVIMALIWWVRDYNHRRAITLLKNEVYSGQEPSRVFAGPYALNPFKWLGVIETPAFYQTQIVDTHTDEVDPQKTAIQRYKPEETAITQAAKRSKLGKFYLDWAKMPQTEVEMISDTEGGGAVVHIHDLRYVYPESKSNFLGIAVTVDKRGNVIEQVMGDRMERCNDPSCE